MSSWDMGVWYCSLKSRYVFLLLLVVAGILPYTYDNKHTNKGVEKIK